MQLSDRSGQVASRPAPNPAIAPGWINNDLTQASAATYSDPDMMNALLAEMLVLATAVGINFSKTDLTQVYRSILSMGYFVDTGATNALTASPPLPSGITLPALSTFPDGFTVRVTPNHTTTITNPTFAWNGGSAIVITFPGGGALFSGAIQLNSPILLMKAGGGTPTWWLISGVPGSLVGTPQEFNAAGTYTYTPSPGTLAVFVEVQAGGAAGAGADLSGASATSIGCGGSAGSYGASFLRSGFSGVTVTVGAGGAGASGTGTSNSGGTSSFGGLISCTGGIGGGGTPAGGGAQFCGNAGGGGTATGGNILNLIGGPGGNAIGVGAFGAVGGLGGASMRFGSGPQGGLNNQNGINASNPGAGGSGAASSNGAARTGGNGKDGCVIVWEYR